MTVARERPTYTTGPFALALRELSVIDRWCARRPVAVPDNRLTRDEAFLQRRELDSWERQRKALLTQLDVRETRTESSGSERSGSGAASDRAPNAVFAFSRGWLLEAAQEALATGGARVVASTTDGACAAGILVAELPDLLLLESPLPSMDTVAIVRLARDLLPATTIILHGAVEGSAAVLAAAGADRVFGGQVPVRAAALVAVAHWLAGQQEDDGSRVVRSSDG